MVSRWTIVLKTVGRDPTGRNRQGATLALDNQTSAATLRFVSARCCTDGLIEHRLLRLLLTHRQQTVDDRTQHMPVIDKLPNAGATARRSPARTKDRLP